MAADALSNFSYGTGVDPNGNTNRFKNIEARLDNTAAFLSASAISVDNQSTILLTPVSTLPTGVPTGSLAMSGSNANIKLYLFTGAGSISSGWVTASIGG